jgi:hypothetical protein
MTNNATQEFRDLSIEITAVFNQKATDPRDFVYGISAIIDPGITMDYSLSTCAVFRETAMKLLLRRRSAVFLLIVFSGVGCQRPSFHSSSIPCLSWVPNLAAPNFQPLEGI